MFRPVVTKQHDPDRGVELTEQDLIDIEAYLVEGAADSERPMTCG